MIRDQVDGEFNPGDRVKRIVTGELGVVLNVWGGTAEVAFGTVRRLLDTREIEMVRDDPLEALLAGELARSEPYALRLQAFYLKHAYRNDPLAGLSNARIELARHQIYVAHRIVNRLRPRMILADEVGLGKTVEAGLILKELRARQLVNRVLVVVPASLQMQWQQELRSKFNEEFQIMDGQTVRFLGRGGDNPWGKQDNVICSHNVAVQEANVEWIIEAGWDLVIFDEAHRVRRRLTGTKVEKTRLYDLADELKETSFGLLLLSATPMQLHQFELYSLVELVEPGLHPDFADYEQRRRQLPMLNELMRSLMAWSSITEQEREESRLRAAGLLDPKQAESIDLDEETGRREMMDVLIEKHPLADVLVRNRKSEIGGFTKREPKQVLVELTPEELELYEDVSEYIRRGYNRAQAQKRYAVGFLMVLYQQMLASSSTAIRASFIRRIARLREQLSDIDGAKRTRRGLTPEVVDSLRDLDEASPSIELLDQMAVDQGAIATEIAELESLVSRLGKMRDSKALELAKAVRAIFEKDRNEKVLIFTRYLETQQFLQEMLVAAGYSVAAFNGQMTLQEKESAVHRFRNAAQILVTTEAGGEGRNFQFAHIMFNYDLPWNPMRIEQRIGRLDRIGQRRTVRIYNLACRGTVEERILDVLHERIGLFRESVGPLDPILGDVEQEIEQLVLGQMSSPDEFAEYAVKLETAVARAREAERMFADFILDTASFRRDQANDLLAREPLARWQDLRTHIGASLEYHGGRLGEHPDGGDVVTLSPRLMARLQTRESAIRGVFDPDLALRREDLPYLAFGHELVDRVVELSAGDELAVAGCRRSSHVTGGVHLELLYAFESEGLDKSGLLLHHLVSEGGDVVETDLRKVPEVEFVSEPITVPGWVASAAEVSAERVRIRLSEERARVFQLHDRRKEDELLRESRVFEYRTARLQRLVDEQERWVDRVERSGSAREKRVLPARVGKLAKDRDRLVSLAEEHELRKEQILAQRADVAVRLVAAGLVVGA